MTKSILTCSKWKMKGKTGRSSICRVHVSRADIRDNIKNGMDNPVIAVHRRGLNVRGNIVIIYDKLGNEVARIVQSMKKPLKCGARVWVETREAVSVVSIDSEGIASELSNPSILLA